MVAVGECLDNVAYEVNGKIYLDKCLASMEWLFPPG